MPHLLDPSTLRVRYLGRRADGRRAYRVEMLGRHIATGSRAELWRALRGRVARRDEVMRVLEECA